MRKAANAVLQPKPVSLSLNRLGVAFYEKVRLSNDAFCWQGKKPQMQFPLFSHGEMLIADMLACAWSLNLTRALDRRHDFTDNPDP
ncbi:hypothetical protein [Thiorhodovibrio frisius]|uniref:Uncharacterized protein n=1 Tax=Thiorhodovibrio frisius TaxID=631362 RepID=H8YX22_9GAMM|nr:hypothetical protein [Thiorhodovibrio frisius]EIC22998.1 hypothetical protein Thi970DRAFT_00647 [Thiorhodovibrio frisius]WPL22734.1 hypothetical protein Thiofri_02904 [Thiorhodovibrio frisius]